MNNNTPWHVLTVLLVVGLFGLCVYNDHLRADLSKYKSELQDVRELRAAPKELTKEIENLQFQADQALAEDWLKVAKDYISEGELAHLNEMYTEVSSAPRDEQLLEFGPKSYPGFCSEARKVVEQALGEARMYSDKRVIRLNNLSYARITLWGFDDKASKATSIKELRKVQHDFDQRKTALLLLLKPAS